MEIAYINDDVIENVITPYLSENEFLYYTNNWDNYKENEVLIIAIENGWLDLLKWALQKYNYSCDLYGEHLTLSAAEYNQFEILKWLHEHNYKFHEQICSHAAMCGNLEMLKWLTEKGCNMYEMVCGYAAKNGHFEIIKWAQQNGCKWDEYTT